MIHEYLHVDVTLPCEAAPLPPVLLIHGAANAAWVWRFWLRELAARGWSAHALDLRGHGESSAADLAHTSMDDYVADVDRIARTLATPPVVFGWSMGGLLAQQFGARHRDLPGLVLLAPSPPLAIQGAGSEESVAEIPDLFGSEYYGLGSPQSATRVLDDLTPDEQEYVLSRPGFDSGLARRDRKRGVAVDAGDVHCPILVIYGERDRYFPPDVSQAIAAFYGASTMAVPPARHWGIVCSAAIVAELAPRVDAWLRTHIREGDNGSPGSP